MRKIKEVLSMDVTKLPNSDAKSTFFQLLSLPLQSICRLAKDPHSALQTEKTDVEFFTPFAEF